MKTNPSSSFFRKLILLLLLAGSTINVKAQLVPIPDAGLRSALVDLGFGSCFTGSSIDSTCSLVINCTNLYLANYGIQNLQGIEAFTNLITLDIDTNNLGTISVLPPLLINLSCSQNPLTSITSLPASLQKLGIQTVSLLPLPALPSGLISLNLETDSVFTLPVFPTGLNSLFLRCNLTALPSLPPSLNSLYCSYNHLTSLPSLPLSLNSLECIGNNITALPSLPPALVYLFCSENNLTFLPQLPATLKQLYCNYNNITSIPDLPDSLDNLDVSYNKNLNCLPELNYINFLEFDSTNIRCLPNVESVSFSNPPLNSIPICDFSNPNGCKTYGNILGKVFHDADNNCTYNSGDVSLSNFKIKLYENGIVIKQLYSGLFGNYSIDTDHNGIYTTEIDTANLPFLISCPSSASFDDTISSLDSIKINRDFAFTCKPGFDLGINSIYNSPFIPAHLATIYINGGGLSTFYGVNCNPSLSGTIRIVLAGPINYFGPYTNALTPSSVNGDTIIYNIADFNTVDWSNDFNFRILVDTTAAINSVATVWATIFPNNDNNPSNNSFIQYITIKSSFDPNDKSVSPPDSLYLFGDRWLTYTVRFQNTGTAAAEKIVVIDTLDANLDYNTFQLLTSSHFANVEISQSGIGTFTFRNINLPDSTSDEIHSHGYLQYRIKAKDNLAVGTSINNTANIYFDYNSPVITNTVTNYITTLVSLPENKNHPLSIYPNPSKDKFTIESADPGSALEIYNILGKLMLNVEIENNHFIIDATSWPSGIYFLRVGTSGKLITKKLIKA